MEANFSPKVKDVMGFSREEAYRLGNDFIGVEHLFLGMIRQGDSTALKILKSLHVNLPAIKTEIEEGLKRNTTPNYQPSTLNFVKQSEKVLKMTYLEAKLFKSPVIGTEHLLLSILKDENSFVCRLLNNYGVIYDNVKEEFETMIEENTLPRAEFPGGNEEEESGEQFSSQRKSSVP